MKRIYNKIPLISVLFNVPGNIHIEVLDLKEADLQWNRENATPVGQWSGWAKEDYKMPTRFQNAALRHVEVPGENQIRFYISTQFEQY